MRIFLIESGGIVGIPLRYEVDISLLGNELLLELERTMDKMPPHAPSSAGEVLVRLERDDGSVKEFNLSNDVSVTPDIVNLVRHLRECAKIVRKD
jgi:hypothetical protein